MSIERFEAALAAEQGCRAAGDTALAVTINVLSDELREECNARAADVAALTNRLQALEASAGDRVDRLVGALEAQVEHIGLLVQCVAQLLGEEAGHPVEDEQGPQRVDLDGESY